MTGPQQYGNGLGPLADMLLFFAACIALYAVIGVLMIIVMHVAHFLRGWFR